MQYQLKRGLWIRLFDYNQ